MIKTAAFYAVLMLPGILFLCQGAAHLASLAVARSMNRAWHLATVAIAIVYSAVLSIHVTSAVHESYEAQISSSRDAHSFTDKVIAAAAAERWRRPMPWLHWWSTQPQAHHHTTNA